MLPVLAIGPLALQVPPLVLLISLALGLSVLERNAARLGLKVGPVSNLALFGLAAAVAGARLGYVIRFPQAFAVDPPGIVSLDPAAFEPAAGAAVGILAAWLYAARHDLLHRSTLDAFASVLPIIYTSIGIANLAGGDAYGEPAYLPWSTFEWGEYRHPFPLYEIAAGLFVLCLWGLRRRARSSGLVFVGVTSLLAVSTLLLETFRADSPLLPGGWRAAQVLSLAVLAVCLALAPRWRKAAGSPTGLTSTPLLRG